MCISPGEPESTNQHFCCVSNIIISASVMFPEQINHEIHVPSCTVICDYLIAKSKCWDIWHIWFQNPVLGSVQWYPHFCHVISLIFLWFSYFLKTYILFACICQKEYNCIIAKYFHCNLSVGIVTTFISTAFCYFNSVWDMPRATHTANWKISDHWYTTRRVQL